MTPELSRRSLPTESAGAGAGRRFHELDALRAVAMLLGIVLHASVYLIPGVWDTDYPDEASDFYAILFFAIHGFRMPVFFLLSGFFTAMLWRRRGLRELGKHRLKRVGLPLAIGAMTVIPVTIWAFAPDDFELVWWPFVWLSTFTHLWFLWHLLWIAGAFTLAARLGLRFDHPWAWWLTLPLTLVPQLLMAEPVFGPDTSDTLVINPVVLVYYGLFFVFGAHLYQRGLETRGDWAVLLIPALTVVFWPALGLMYEVKTKWAYLASAPLQAGYAWLMCFGLMGAVPADSLEGARLGTLCVGRFLLDVSVASADYPGGLPIYDGLAYHCSYQVRAGVRRGDGHIVGHLPVGRPVHAGWDDVEWEAGSGGAVARRYNPGFIFARIVLGRSRGRPGVTQGGPGPCIRLYLPVFVAKWLKIFFCGA